VRAKIAVSSNNSDIDPVGACVGMKGSRVQSVVQELRGEKIDIIPWHVDAAKFVCNALAPAEIARVIIDESARAMEVIVPDEFLSIAIGKRGQNVRLASKLTGWHLDVQSESQYSEAMRSGYDSLVSLPGVGISLADALYEKGFFSAEEVSHATVDDLLLVREMDEDKAAELIEAARTMIEEAAAMEAEAEAAGEDLETPPEAEDAAAESAEADATDSPPAEPEAASDDLVAAEEDDASAAEPAEADATDPPAAEPEAASDAAAAEEDDASPAEPAPTGSTEDEVTADAVPTAVEAPVAEDPSTDTSEPV
jgi:N utilization substance protein A